MTTETLAPRVAKGAEWMDANRPGWFARVDISRFDIGNADRCVLGQECGSYWIALREYHDLKPVNVRHVRDWAYAHGFNDMRSDESGLSECTDERGGLQECWITEILSRRFAAIPQPAIETESVSA